MHQRIVRFLLLLPFLAHSIPSIAQTTDAPIEIKGIRIGMPQAELQEKYPSWDGFTIAGVSGKYPKSPVALQFRDGKLDSFNFFFRPDHFEDVLGALKEKYSATRCESSTVGNAAGAKFEQVTCTLSDQSSMLRLTRYVDLQTSSLTVVSRELFNDLLRKRKQQKSDF